MGDRSQITAVALGAANEVWGVIIGGSFVSLLLYINNAAIGTRFMLIGRCLARIAIYEQNITWKIDYFRRNSLLDFRY